MAEQKPISEHVIVKWLQYSKRIAVVGLVQWCIVAAISLSYEIGRALTIIWCR